MKKKKLLKMLDFLAEKAIEERDKDLELYVIETMTQLKEIDCFIDELLYDTEMICNLYKDGDE